MQLSLANYITALMEADRSQQQGLVSPVSFSSLGLTSSLKKPPADTIPSDNAADEALARRLQFEEQARSTSATRTHFETDTKNPANLKQANPRDSFTQARSADSYRNSSSKSPLANLSPQFELEGNEEALNTDVRLANSEGYVRGAQKLKRMYPPNAKWSWDYKVDTFPTFRSRFEGHYRSQGLSYFLKPVFQEAYQRLGLALVEEYPDTGISKSQMALDTESVYGGIEILCSKKGHGRSHLLAHEDTSDGFLTWYDMVAEYDKGGCADLEELDAEAKVHQKYYVGFPGGLAQWVNDKEDGFTYINSGAVERYDDAAKIRILQTTIFTSETTDLYLQVTKMTDYMEILLLIKRFARMMADSEETTAKSKAHYTEADMRSKVISCSSVPAPVRFPEWIAEIADIRIYSATTSRANRLVTR
jgi:hypothetical protein